MNVLSLFDGMSCGRVALERAGIEVTNYFACEIDKYAIQVSRHNYDDIRHLGDVRGIIIEYDAAQNTTRIYNYLTECDYTFKGKFDLIIGGSPCQGFSFAGKQLNFDDPRSKLFFEFVRLYNDIKSQNPEALFFLENVVMKKEYQQVISEHLNVDPVLINSALVSAQNRKRLYWTNLPFYAQPIDREIYLKDILEESSAFEIKTLAPNRALGISYNENGNIRPYKNDGKNGSLSEFGTLLDRNNKSNSIISAHAPHVLEPEGVIKNKNKIESRNDKSMCLDANYHKGFDNHGQRTMIKVGLAEDIKGHDYNKRVYSVEGKAPTLNAGSGGNLEPKVAIMQKARGFNKGGLHEGKSPPITSNSWQENNKLINGITYRKLTPIECERLQTVSDNYTSCVSNTQRYKMLGNGWNVDTIVHFFRWLKIIDEL